MINWLTVIFACQLAGEAITAASGIPLPGPVIGMVILFVGLMIKGSIPAGLEPVAGALLANLSLLFVPAGTGIMVHLALLKTDGLAVSVALLASTIVTVAVTGLLMQFLTRRRSGQAEDPA
jgi:putative effector of murein hydrolase LrgA (UPF0299 family)